MQTTGVHNPDGDFNRVVSQVQADGNGRSDRSPSQAEPRRALAQYVESAVKSNLSSVRRQTHRQVSLRMRAILDRLDAYPRAEDSAEGVAPWWLGARGESATLLDAKDALARLVALRRLRRVQLADGTTLSWKDWNNHPARS